MAPKFRDNSNDMKTKVSIARCKTYDPEEVQPSVRRAFELLGGISAFVKKGEKILVKPNMLSARPPEDGVNTHIEIIRAVVRLIKECEAFPVIGDTPGGFVDIKEAYEASGIMSVAKEEGAELAEVKNVRIEKGFPIASYFFECDKIISLPKMKTHSLMGLTGGIKNMYGGVSGLNKSERHKRFPKPEDFANVLMDVFEVLKPHLVLMDAVIAMDGYGPAAGTLKPVGLLIASDDSVAVDSIFSYLIGIDPLDVLTTKEAHRRGIGETDIDNIEIVGEKIEKGFIKGFRLASSSTITKLLSLPNPFVRALTSFVKFCPYINERDCKRCKICAKTCPVAAITIDEKNATINKRKCINCMCCHEVCPYKAIQLRRNILARVLAS
ncbi:DUF362 domain-containing protein [Candidatus Omnitrophota bacterium]